MSLLGTLIVIGLLPCGYLPYTHSAAGLQILSFGQLLADPKVRWALIILLSSIMIYSLLSFPRGSPVLDSCMAGWLCLACGSGLIRYVLDKPITGPSEFMVLFIGLAIGIAAARVAAGLGRTGLWALAAIYIFAFLLCVACRLDHPTVYRYHGVARMSGPYANPNTFGLLMGSGSILAVAGSLAMVGTGAAAVAARFGFASAAAVLLSACVRSYSRGAWVAAVVGFLWLGWSLRPILGATAREGFARVRRWIWACAAIATVGIGAAIATSVAPGGENLFKQRLRSLLNSNDFSWQNRLVAWQGALQMTADRPLIGWGWNEVRPIYRYLYMPLTMADDGAIETNDVLKVAVAAGLFFFAAWMSYIVLMLASALRSSWDPHNAARPEASPARGPPIAGILRAGFAAAAVALFVGCWFDPVWFELPTASAFWCMLHSAGSRNDGTSAPLSAGTLVDGNSMDDSASCVTGILRK